MTHQRVDGEHSNAYEAWKKMGSPQTADARRSTQQLEKGGKLRRWVRPSGCGCGTARSVSR